MSLITRHWDDKCTLAVFFHLARDEVLQLLLNYDRRCVALVAPELELLAGGRRGLSKLWRRLLVVEIVQSPHGLLARLRYRVVPRL